MFECLIIILQDSTSHDSYIHVLVFIVFSPEVVTQ